MLENCDILSDLFRSLFFWPDSPGDLPTPIVSIFLVDP